MLLTKHEDQTFTAQTVYVSGQAFIRCNFVACTLVLRGETVYHLEECSFDRCNWHVDSLLLWGSADSIRQVKAIINLLEQGLQHLQGNQPGTTTEAGQGDAPGEEGSPFAT